MNRNLALSGKFEQHLARRGDVAKKNTGVSSLRLAKIGRMILSSCILATITHGSGVVRAGDMDSKEPEEAKKLSLLNTRIYYGKDGRIAEIAIFRKVTDRDLAGVDFSAFKSLSGIWLSSNDVSDKSLTCLSKAPHVRGITIAGTGITSNGLNKYIGGQKSLSALTWLANEPITDELFDGLEAHPNLGVLQLPNSRITDLGVKRISSLKGLFSLDIRF